MLGHGLLCDITIVPIFHYLENYLRLLNGLRHCVQSKNNFESIMSDVRWRSNFITSKKNTHYQTMISEGMGCIFLQIYKNEGGHLKLTLHKPVNCQYITVV